MIPRPRRRRCSFRRRRCRVVVAPAERERRLRAASRPRRYAEQGEVFAVARGGGRRRGEQPLVARRGRGEQSFQRGTSRPLVRVFSECVVRGAGCWSGRLGRACGASREEVREKNVEEEATAPRGAEHGRYRDHGGVRVWWPLPSSSFPWWPLPRTCEFLRPRKKRSGDQKRHEVWRNSRDGMLMRWSNSKYPNTCVHTANTFNLYDHTRVSKSKRFKPRFQILIRLGRGKISTAPTASTRTAENAT